MRPLCLLSLLLLPQLGWAQSDAGTVVDEARQLMHEGLERDLPAPSSQGSPQWPAAEASLRAPAKVEPGPLRVDGLSDRVRSEATLRARALAEEQRTVPDNLPGAAQERTRAAKAVGPARPRPPRP